MPRLPRIPSKMLYAIVVGVLLLGCAGVLVPAVARVREAANRSVCTCHLKCLTLAVHNYAAVHYRMPAGTQIPYPPRPDSLPPERRLSWYVPLLPYVEQDKTYKLFALDVAADDERNRVATSARFRNFCCPSSGELKERNGGVADPVTGAFVYPGGDAAWKSPGPVTHYIGIAGIGADAALLDSRDARAGVFGYAPRFTLEPHSIGDGTSNTLMFFESGLNPGHWAYGGPATVRGIEPDAIPFIGEGRPIGGFHAVDAGWFSLRRRLAMVATCDGSIRSIGNDISPEVLAALATANGNEKIPADW